MFLGPFRLFALFGVALFATGVAFSQTDVVTNGSFESGLTGWTAAPSSTGNDAVTTCGFNASTAGGTETLTGTPSLPPSSGTQLAMGSAQDSTSGGHDSSCTLYQDVAIPADAKTAVLSLKWGLKYVGSGMGQGAAALLAGLFSSTATVPYFTASSVGGINFYEPASSDTALVSASSASFNVASLAGTTARLVLFNAIAPVGAGRASVGGFDEVQLMVTAPATIGKSFGAASIPFNGTTGLSFTITQPSVAAVTLTGAAFTDSLPSGLSVATPNGLAGSCGGGTITAVPGSGSVTLSGGTVAAGSSCTFSVNVTGTTAGSKNNSVTLSSTNGGTGNTSNASLTVVPPPTVTSVSPNSGPTAGGTSVTITGTTFTGASSVTFGGTAAASFSVVNATTITATVPAGAAGTASVIVTTPSGSNAANTLYSWVASPTVTSVDPGSGPTAGGNTVTITGTSFTGATAVAFAGTAASSFTVVNATTITATVPSGAAGSASVIVTTPGGSNAANTLYSYAASPTIPTLGEWGMAGLASLLILLGWFSLRRREAALDRRSQ